VAEKQRGMGRGLAAILSVAPKDEAEELRELPIELVVPNPHQPRSTFDEASLLSLAESIKLRGVRPLRARRRRAEMARGAPCRARDDPGGRAPPR
jgi:hypothetical protein